MTVSWYRRLKNLKKRSNIVFFLPNLHGGGTERSFVQMANHVVQFEPVDFVLADASGPYLGELSSKIRLINLQTTSRLICLLRLVLVLRKLRPKCLISALCQANFGAIIAAKIVGLKGANLVCQRVLFSRAWREWLNPLQYFLHKLLFRRVFNQAAIIIANSKSVREDLVRELNLDKSRVLSILNPVDFHLVHSGLSEPITHHWFDSNRTKPTVCFVGSLSQRKDVGTCLHAFSLALKHIDANLFILGDGPDREIYKNLASCLGITRNVEFGGFQNNPFKYMAKCDLFISTSKFEGCPNVIQQALACGARVLATDEPGGTAEVLGYGKYGELVDVEDVTEISKKIVEILNSKDTNIAKKNRIEYAHTFNPKIIYDEYYEHIKSIAQCKDNR
jgi:glycosyltransferase involved in cell wall biosynthesis